MFKSLNYFNETGMIFYFEFRNVFTFFPLKFFKIYFLGSSTSGSFLYPASNSEPCPLSRVTGLKTYPLSQQPPPPKRSTFSLASNTLLFVFKKALFYFFLSYLQNSSLYTGIHNAYSSLKLVFVIMDIFPIKLKNITILF